MSFDGNELMYLPRQISIPDVPYGLHQEFETMGAKCDLGTRVFVIFLKFCQWFLMS